MSRTFYDANGRAVATMDPIVVENGLSPTDLGFNIDLDEPETLSENFRMSQTLYDPAGRAFESRRLAGLEITIEAVTVPGATVPIYRTLFDPPTEAEPIELAAAILGRNQTLYDSAGRVSQTITYDATDVSDPFGAVLSRTWFEYDAAGRQTAAIQEVDLNHNGAIQTTDANSDGVPDGGEELVRTITEYDNAGQQKSTTDALGNTTYYEYDKAGRQTAVIAAAVLKPGTTDLVHPRTEMVYDSLGRRTRLRENLTQSELTDPLTIDDSAVRETVYAYDNQGRLKQVDLPEVTSALTGSMTGVATYQYEYDVYGNQIKISDPMDGYVYPGDDPLDKETRFTYDHFGRQTSRTLPDGLTETMHYSDAPLPTSGLASSVGLGQLEYSIDFQQRVTAYRYDNTATGGGRLVGKYFYNSESTYLSDRPDNDLDDWVQQILYTYDALGRVLTITDSAFASASHPLTEQTYDADGRLAQIASPQGVINYGYNALGQLSRTWTSDPADVNDAITETQYAYDALGRLKSVTVVERNDAGPLPVQDQEVTQYRYDANGNLDLEIRPGGAAGDIVSDYQYDALNRLDLLINFKDANDDGAYDDGIDNLLGRYDYTLRADGMRERVVETDNQGHTTTIDWVYDELGRLTEERYDFDHLTDNNLDDDYDYITTYGFDLASNRVRKEVDKLADGSVDETITYDYDQNDRLETEVLDSTNNADDRNTRYTYDGTEQTSQTEREGTVIDDGDLVKTTTYIYDVQGRLAQVTVAIVGGSTTVSSYKYSDADARVEQSVTVDGGLTVTTVYHIDPQNHTGYAKAIEEIVDGTRARSYAIGHAITSQALGDGTVHHFLHDGHGSTRALVDALVQVVQRYAYEAYGATLPGVGLTLANSAQTTWLFANDGQYDPATGLTNHLKRWREGGRFLTLDSYAGSMQDPLSLHKYLYAHGNPVMGIDPSGMNTFLADLGTATHKAISAAHRSENGGTITYSASIPGAGGAIYPDIMDYSQGQIGEIKPFSVAEVAKGYVQLRAAIAIANGISWKYKGNTISVDRVPHSGPQSDWIAEDWNPGIRAFLPGLIDAKFSDFVAVTLGNFAGLIVYQRFQVPKGLTAVEYASEAVRLAERIAQNIEVLPNGEIVVGATEALAIQATFVINTSTVLGGLAATGAAASVAYVAYGLSVGTLPTLRFGI